MDRELTGLLDDEDRSAAFGSDFFVESGQFRVELFVRDNTSQKSSD